MWVVGQTNSETKMRLFLESCPNKFCSYNEILCWRAGQTSCAVMIGLVCGQLATLYN